MILELARQSAGAGLGVFIGVLIGLSIRRRKGKTEGLISDSVPLTAAAAGGLALLAMMAFTWMQRTM
ncbi:hypothetical protein [Salipiger mucosus]|uniref:Uncharacterized protein n=1 Tax=Salipiger mucosus DSM 16094 TaxID=1123237 RepID=S9S4C2_9RHOB|nr:hypothetical protein [Salipiger mucosus]EPX85025.1 hypothetical protein Salmuc_00622 [Salipiger mucosus DSM 16094]